MEDPDFALRVPSKATSKARRHLLVDGRSTLLIDPDEDK